MPEGPSNHGAPPLRDAEAAAAGDRRGPGLLVAVLRAVGVALLRIPRWAGALLTLAWASTIYLISDSADPLPVAPPVPLFVNNLAHAPLFGFLAFLALVALPRRVDPAGFGPWPRLDRRTVGGLLAAVAAYSLFDEWHQSWVPGRHASLGDVLTDVTGAASVLLVADGLGRAAARTGPVALRLALGAAACAGAAAVATWIVPQPV